MNLITNFDVDQFPVLEMNCTPCDYPLSHDDEKAILEMDKVLNELGNEAAGLAACQIGYPKRMFMLRQNEENKMYINPEVVDQSSSLKKDDEACLSLPGYYGKVKRPKWIEISYTTISGEQKQERFSGFWARAVSHELDHLKGILITRHLEKDLSKVVKRTKFGMKLTISKQKEIRSRRAKNKRSKKARKLNR